MHTWSGPSPPDVVDGYQITAQILQTFTAKIYEVFYAPRPAEKFVLKCLKKYEGRQSLEQIENECTLMNQLKHENVVELQAAPDPDANFHYLVMPMASDGDAWNYVECEGTMPESLVCFVIFSVLKAVEYLHGQGIWHRDIKPENILLNGLSTSDPQVVLADFGSARRFADGEYGDEEVGTPGYQAPEICRQQPCMFCHSHSQTMNQSIFGLSVPLCAISSLEETRQNHWNLTPWHGTMFRSQASTLFRDCSRRIPPPE
jgi:serine/threonine protein kinase